MACAIHKPELYAVLVEDMPVAAVVHRVDFDDPGNSVWVYANRAVSIASSLREPPRIGLTVRQTSPNVLLPVHGSLSIAERWIRALRTGETETLEFEYRMSSGAGMWYRAHYVPLDGELIATVYENITDRKHVEQELAAARRLLERRVEENASELARTREQLQAAQRLEALGRLAGGIAHDFNNMLSVIVGAAGLARRKTGSEEVRRELAQVEAAADRAAELTKQLLAFSRRQLLEPRSVSLNEVVALTEPMLRRVLGEHIAIRTELAGDAARVRVDPAKLEQALVNLALNARDAMPQGGTLTISTANIAVAEAELGARGLPHPGSWVTLTVRDTGHGMSAETLAHIFEPFFTTKQDGGTGLGLATVFGTIKQSNGHIAVESEPQRGATFTIYLPPSAETRAASTPPPPAARSRAGRDTGSHDGGGEIVLVVEDDPLVRGVACRILLERGYRVIEAASAEEAIDRVREVDNAIDALLTDMVLPGMNGLELARRVRRDRGDLPVVCMSGYADASFGAGLPDEDGVVFVAKPIEPEALVRKIRAALAAPR